MERTRTSERPARLHDWSSLVATLAALLAVGTLLAGRFAIAAVCAAAAVAGALHARRSSRRQPAPMPYSLRWVLYLPRWPLTPERLRTVLEPRPGERLLEVGPGVGIYALPVAAALEPGGTLDAVDIQPEMLATLERRAAARSVANIVAQVGDAQRLPYPDATFDAAYLIGVLGEVPDPGAALRELRRVLKPGGRLVLGEVLVFDPDGLRLPTLRAWAEDAGFLLERRLGPGAAYFARFRPRP